MAGILAASSIRSAIRVSVWLLVVAKKIGMETTTYVRNIYKSCAAYKITEEARAAAGKAREKVERKP